MTQNNVSSKADYSVLNQWKTIILINSICLSRSSTEKKMMESLSDKKKEFSNKKPWSLWSMNSTNDKYDKNEKKS